MNGSLLSGLGAAFGTLGKGILQDRQRQLDAQEEDRKAQLKNKLEMDLMKAKFEFMKANPQYQGHITNLAGDVISFDQFGSPTVTYKAPAEERAINLGKAKAEQEAKEAQIDYYKSAATSNAAHAALYGAQQGLTIAKTANPLFGKAPPKPKPNPYEKDPQWLENQAISMASKAFPGGPDVFKVVGEAKQQPYIDAAMAKLQQQGYKKKPNPDAPEGEGNVFSSLIPPQIPPDDDSGDGATYDPDIY